MTERVVEVQDIEFAWRKDDPAVLSIAGFTVLRDQHLFLKGPSGSGKSTLLNLLGGVVTARQGRVQVLGSDLAAMSATRRDRFRADHIGFLFQLFNLMPYLNILDNVLLPLRFSRRRRDSAGTGSSAVGEAGRLLDHLGLGRELFGRRASELSVGQQQRVAAARALIGNPELVIADEPTSALDADTRTVFIDLLRRECRERGSSLVFVSHDASLEPLFDRSLSLSEINRVAVAAIR